jgi:hypothetical protein
LAGHHFIPILIGYVVLTDRLQSSTVVPAPGTVHVRTYRYRYRTLLLLLGPNKKKITHAGPRPAGHFDYLVPPFFKASSKEQGPAEVIVLV